MLNLKNVSVAYKDKKVLDNLSLTASKGEIIGLVAPNGTGKTTSFNVIANFLKPNSGNVTINKHFTYRNEREEMNIYNQLATFPDQSDLFDELSGIDHMKLYGNMWKGTTRHIPGIIEELKMGHYVKKKAGTYSLGMRQRLCFAMMAATDTSIMLMDEVMNGLDVENTALLSNYLIKMKAEQKLIFVASHLLENLDLYADRVLYLKGGKFVHEQRLNEKNEDYIKIDIEPNKYEKIIQEFTLPEEHQYIANHLLCIPLEGMQLAEQTMWIERLLEFKEHELTIGPMGTVEFYEKYYHDLY